MAQQWDSSYNVGGFTISNGGRTATPQQNSTNKSPCICTEFKTSGKWYWEIFYKSAGSVSMFVGIANSTLPNTVFLGEDTNGVGWNNVGFGVGNDGNVIYNWDVTGVRLAFGGHWYTAASYPYNANMGFAMDLVNGTYWMRPDAVSTWNGNGSANPATNTGGIAIPAPILAHPITIAGSQQAFNNQMLMELCCDPSQWLGTAPAGFLDWDHVFTPKVDHDVAQRVMRGIMRGVMQPVVP